MPTLQHLQNTMAEAIISGKDGAVVANLVAGSGDPRRRFQIFRNNWRLSLTTALMDNFPVTAAMVDERFFRFVADGFIRHHPPREPRLNLYGRELPGYLAAMVQMAPYPEAVAMARLEWHILEVLAAPSVPPTDFSALARLGVAGASAGLQLQPCLRLGVARHDVCALWHAHQGDGPHPGSQRRDRVHGHIVWRAGSALRLRALTPDGFAFVRAIARGQSIEQATVRALRRDPLFDLARQVIDLFQAGLVAAVTASTPAPLSTGDPS
jgi:Putative DNA-binding domain